MVPACSVASLQFQAVQFAGDVRDLNPPRPQLHDSADHRTLFGVPNESVVVVHESIGRGPTSHGSADHRPLVRRTLVARAEDHAAPDQRSVNLALRAIQLPRNLIEREAFLIKFARQIEKSDRQGMQKLNKIIYLRWCVCGQRTPTIGYDALALLPMPLRLSNASGGVKSALDLVQYDSPFWEGDRADDSACKHDMRSRGF